MELFAYIMVSILFFIKSNKKLLLMVVLGVTIVLQIMAPFFIHRGKNLNFLAPLFNLDHSMMQNLYAFFSMGCLLALLNFEKLSKKTINYTLLISILIFIVAIIFGEFKHTQYFFIPIICISFGVSSWAYINQLGQRLGDLSYGAYIYAFPVQQMIEYYIKPNLFEMIVYSFIIVFIISFISWHMIEKQILSLKNIFR